MTLLAIYLGCLVLGGILVGASVVGGGQDGGDDHGGDNHAGGDHDGHAHAGNDHVHLDPHTGLQMPDASILTVLRSVRFWTFFAAAFGLAGTLLTLTGAPSSFSLPLSLVTGALAGGGVTWALRRLTYDTVGTATSTRQLAGREAEVVLAIGPARQGKIRVSHNGQILDLPATTRDDHPIERGQRVLIVEMNDGCADVTPAEPNRPPPLPLAH